MSSWFPHTNVQAGKLYRLDTAFFIYKWSLTIEMNRNKFWEYPPCMGVVEPGNYFMVTKIHRLLPNNAHIWQVIFKEMIGYAEPRDHFRAKAME